MARSNSSAGKDGESDISIIGPRMKVVGDLFTEGTVRVEGRVEGNVEAGKAVVVGKDGDVQGDIRTEDSIISGRIRGSVTAASRLEIQSTARIDGEVHARRMQLEEGAMLNGTVRMGEVEIESEPAPSVPAEAAPSPGTGQEGGPSRPRPSSGSAPGAA